MSDKSKISDSERRRIVSDLVDAIVRTLDMADSESIYIQGHLPGIDDQCLVIYAGLHSINEATYVNSVLELMHTDMGSVRSGVFTDKIKRGQE